MRRAWALGFSLTLGLAQAVAEPVSQERIPLAGYPIRFSDPYGPHPYSSEIVRYQTEDGASIEATLLLPKTDEARPGIVFVHMWARDRNTWWGLPEYLASHGYPSIAMDLRGHGGSKFPGRDVRITTRNKDLKYMTLLRDIPPAIRILNDRAGVKKDHLILAGASLGCPLGVLVVEKDREKFIGMIHLSPSLSYFDVDCRAALAGIRWMPNCVVAEKTDRSFQGAKSFFEMSQGYKAWLQLDQGGHGTNSLFYDAGLPSVILSWVRQLEDLAPVLKKLWEAEPQAGRRRK